MGKTLLHGLFPVVRAEVLRLLFTNPGQELYVRELARLSFLTLQTVQDELAKLEAAELISSRSNGYQRFYRANSKHPLYTTLRRIVITGSSHPRRAAPARGTRGKKRRSTARVKN
jgi:DNA-binding transcriptional ArsR family regulator